MFKEMVKKAYCKYDDKWQYKHFRLKNALPEKVDVHTLDDIINNINDYKCYNSLIYNIEKIITSYDDNNSYYDFYCVYVFEVDLYYNDLLENNLSDLKLYISKNFICLYNGGL